MSCSVSYHSITEIVDTLSHNGRTYYGVFSDECDRRYTDDTNHGISYFHGGGNQQNNFFVVDLKVQVHIKKVIVRNSANSDHNNG